MACKQMLQTCKQESFRAGMFSWYQGTSITISSTIHEAVNYYHKALHLGCCGSPRSASDNPPDGHRANDKCVVS